MWKLLAALVVSFVVWTQFVGPRLAASRRPEPTGQWRAAGGQSLDLLRGGGAVVSLLGGGDSGLAGRWRVDGNVLLIELGGRAVGPGAHSMRLPFALDGDELVVEIGGRPQLFQRKG
jgi:hypothetical protein